MNNTNRKGLLMVKGFSPMCAVFFSLALFSGGASDAAAESARIGNPATELTDIDRVSAEMLPESIRMRGGLCVFLGGTEVIADAAKVIASGPWIVHWLEADEKVAQRARNELRERGLYGQVTVEHWPETHLPYADNLVNLILSENNELAIERDELLRVLAPQGTALIGGEDGMRRLTGERPDDMGEWTHPWHDANGSLSASDRAFEVPNAFQWVAGPPFPLAGRKSSTGVMLSAGGRTFQITQNVTENFPAGSQNYLVARDAFNGILLWSRKWTGPTASHSRGAYDVIVTCGKKVYGVGNGDVSVFDASTGDVISILSVDATPGKLLLVDDILVVQSPEGLTAFDTNEGALLWRRELDEPWGALAADGLVYCLSSSRKEDGSWRHELTAVELENGAVAWKQPTESQSGHPQTTGLRLHFAGEGIVCLIEWDELRFLCAEDGSKLWRHKTSATARGGHDARMAGHFMFDGEVWIRDQSNSRIYMAFDPRSGEMLHEADAIEALDNEMLSEWLLRKDPDNVGKEENWYAIEEPCEQWRVIPVPSFYHDTWAGRYHGYAWYRVSFNIPEDVTDGIVIEFGGVDEQGWVYVNGELVGEQTAESTGKSPTQLWEQSFFVDVPDRVIERGEKNILTVRVHTSAHAGGLYQPVTFYPVGLEKLKLSRHPGPTGSNRGCQPVTGTPRYIIDARRSRMWDVETGEREGFKFVRGGCQFSLIVANAMAYMPPNACGCLSEQYRGNVAIVRSEDAGIRSIRPGDLIMGPAYGEIEVAGAGERSNAWPMYRRDGRRSAYLPQNISPELREVWRKMVGSDAEKDNGEWRLNFGRPLSPPVAAGGMLLLAEPQRHQVIALDISNGEEKWRFTAAGRVTSPPTIHGGLVLFGAHDGYVYALRAADGELVWRRRAAPSDRRIMAYGQVESAWPVRDVLVHDGVAIAAAGRAADAGGGAVINAFQPDTGEVRWSSRIEPYQARHGKPDLLVTDGQDVYLMNKRINTETGEISGIDFGTITRGREWDGSAQPLVRYPEGVRYLRSGQAGFFETSWTRLSIGLRKHQSSWTWDESGGEIVAFSPDVGYAFQVDVGGNMLSSPETRGGGRIEARARGAENSQWLHEIDGRAQVQAMLVTENALFVAGPNDRGEPIKGGGFLRILRREDGGEMNEVNLPAAPVHDGMAAVDGRVFIVLEDGSVVCLQE